MPGPRPKYAITLTPEQEARLQQLSACYMAPFATVQRAQIVLLAGQGRPAREIADRVGCAERTVKLWRSRYEQQGLEGLRDRPKAGRPLTHGASVRARLIALACTRPPARADGLRRERWTHAELAEAVGMSPSQAHVILRQADIRPHLTEYWVMSELGPDFDAKAAEICGLYLDPPAGAIVVSIDEKTSIAAREPARPDTLPVPGKPARRDSEYLRNGTTNLFAALQVHHGEVAGMTSATRNRWDFLAFLDQLEGQIPAAQQVIAVLDNLSTHKTREVQAWLSVHSRWRFVFTPTHASWLNQVECFFSILARRVLRHGAFTGPEDLSTQMLAFVEHYNLTAKPFAWTYAGKVLTA